MERRFVANVDKKKSSHKDINIQAHSLALTVIAVVSESLDVSPPLPKRGKRGGRAE